MLLVLLSFWPFGHIQCFGLGAVYQSVGSFSIDYRTRQSCDLRVHSGRTLTRKSVHTHFPSIIGFLRLLDPSISGPLLYINTSIHVIAAVHMCMLYIVSASHVHNCANLFSSLFCGSICLVLKLSVASLHLL